MEEFDRAFRLPPIPSAKYLIQQNYHHTEYEGDISAESYNIFEKPLVYEIVHLGKTEYCDSVVNIHNKFKMST